MADRHDNFLINYGGSKVFWTATAVAILIFIGSIIFPNFIGFDIIKQSGGIAVNSFVLTVLMGFVIDYIMWRIKERDELRRERDEDKRTIAQLRKENQQLRSNQDRKLKQVNTDVLRDF